MMQTSDMTIAKQVTNGVITIGPNWQSLVFDSAHPDSPFSDIRVRQAIAYAIDSNALQLLLGQVSGRLQINLLRRNLFIIRMLLVILSICRRLKNF